MTDIRLTAFKPPAWSSINSSGFATNMAPEVLRKDKYSEKADIYAFSIVLYEMFSGYQAYSCEPFRSMDVASLKSSVISGVRPALDDLPPQLRQIVSDCWNQRPERRSEWDEIVSRLQVLDEEDSQTQAAESSTA